MEQTGLNPKFSRMSEIDFWKVSNMHRTTLIFALSLALLISSLDYAFAEEVLGTPLQQIKKGISPHDVKCKDGLELIFKATDGLPACVTIFTKDRLVHIGWAENEGFGSKFAIGGVRIL